MNADISWSPDQPIHALPHCDTLIALWGVTSGTKEELKANQDLAWLSLKVARHCGAKRILHISSAAVYGPGHNMTETTQTPKPANAYGASKLAMEKLISTFPACDRIAHCCLRLANVVGADSLAPALRGDGPHDVVHLDQFTDGGGPVRSYIAPGHLLHALCSLSQLPPQALPPILNVTSPTPVAMADLMHAADRPFTWRPAPSTATQHVTLSGEMLTALLPQVFPLTSAAEMIESWQELESA